jgi:hypothetical protein
VPLPRLPFLDRESVANVQGLGSLPTVRLERKIGRLSAEIMERLKDALAFALDLYALPINAQPAQRFHLAVSSPIRRSDYLRGQTDPLPEFSNRRGEPAALW